MANSQQDIKTTFLNLRYLTNNNNQGARNLYMERFLAELLTDCHTASYLKECYVKHYLLEQILDRIKNYA